MFIFILTFTAATLFIWWVLQVAVGKHGRFEKRLNKYSGIYTRPLSLNDKGDPVTTSARSVEEPAAPRKPQHKNASKNPLVKLLEGSKQRKRRNAFLKQINDALTLISSSMKAGYSFLQAMEMVAKETPAPLGEEFGRAVHEMSLGATVEESLEEMVRRVGLEDLRLVVTAVLVQRQVGGNLAEVLDTISHTIRERIRIQGEISTLTAQGRISGWVVGCLPIGLIFFISLINPVYMGSLFASPLGWLLLFMGMCSQLIGLFIIRKIIQIEV